MPDIVSRIKVEAQGADAAAREIRKLKDAYAEVSAAAKGMSGAGGADPFSAATTAPGGGIIGGQRSPSEVRQQQKFNDDWRQGAEDRLRNNQNFPSRNGGGSPAAPNASNMIHSVYSGAQQLDNGQTLGALGTGISSLGKLIGPLGTIALAAGAAITTGQALANPAIERRDRIWGSGATQRMGGDYTRTANWEALMKSKGIHKSQVDMFTSAASGSGFSWDGEGADYASGVALQAQASTGLGIGTSASMLGALNRAGLSQAHFNHSTIGAGVGTFGASGLDPYIKGLTSLINTREGAGINMTSAGLAGMQDLITGLGTTGGLSVEGSVAAATRLSSRGISAAKLGSSEDLLTMFAMGGQGKSLTDMQIAMEQNPEQAVGAVYDILKKRYSGDEDSLNQAFASYTGGSMSETVALRKTLDEGGSYKDHRASWDKVTADQELTSNLQLQTLFTAQEAALNKIVGPLGKLASAILGRDPTNNTGDVAYGDLFGGKTINTERTDIDANFVVLKPENVINDDPGMKSRFSDLGSGLGLDLSDTFGAFKEGNLGIQLFGNANTEGIGSANTHGGFGDFAEEMVLGMFADALAVAPDRKTRGKVMELSQHYSTRVNDANSKLYSNINTEEGAKSILVEILDQLRVILPVYTDGDE